MLNTVPTVSENPWGRRRSEVPESRRALTGNEEDGPMTVGHPHGGLTVIPDSVMKKAAIDPPDTGELMGKV